MSLPDHARAAALPGEFEHHTGKARSSRRATAWGKRLGLAAVIFFTIKGLAWLIVPAVIAYWATR